MRRAFGEFPEESHTEQMETSMANGRLAIGWARGEITPLRKTLVQGQFHTRISSEVVSPLTATA